VTWDLNLLRPAYKWTLSAAFVGCWIVSVFANGGLGRLENNIALSFFVAGVGSLSVFGWLLLKNERFRTAALRPEADFASSVKSLTLITWVASAIAVGGVVKLIANVA
jgi:hypothetical protein